MPDDTEMYSAPADNGNEAVSPATEVVEAPEPEQEMPETGLDDDSVQDNAPAASNTVVLSSSLEVYRHLVQQLAVSKQAINSSRHELADVRQHIRELSSQVKRDPRLEGDADSHDLHTSKVAAQYDDCGSIIAYAEQVRRNVYDNVGQVEELLSPMSQSVELLKLRVRHIRLLEELLAAQETCMRLEIQQRNADACIWQLADILKV